MIDPHPLFDQQQHPVCSKRQTLHLIIVIAAPPSLSLFLAPMLESYAPSLQGLRYIPSIS